MPFGIIFSRTKSLAGLLPCQHGIAKIFDALALIGTTCIVIAHRSKLFDALALIGTTCIVIAHR
jgi:hypothetical protein